jgi:hypothetical protein
MSVQTFESAQLTGVLAVVSEHLADLVANLAIGNLDVVLGRAVLRHEREETVVSNIELRRMLVVARKQGCRQTHELVLLAADIGDVHVVGGRAEFFQLLVGEDVDGDQVDLGVAVLASLGGGHFDNLAGAVLDDDKTVLPQGRALDRVRLRGAGIGGLERVLMLAGCC